MKYSILIITIAIVLFNICILAFPQEILAASKDGLLLWFNHILPTLLPFLIAVNILTRLNILTLIGLLLSPIMKIMFRLPGVSGVALICGMCSGYPIGAKVTTDLYTQGHLTRKQGQVLLAFSNNAGPLFIIGFIGISLFQDARVGYFIILMHYTSAIVCGVLFRVFMLKDDFGQENIKQLIDQNFSRKYNSKINFGEILSQSIMDAMQLMLIICGYVVFFSVIIAILNIVFSTLYETFNAVFTGFVEMTNGVYAFSELPLNRLNLSLLVAVVTFGGLCIHFQVYSVIFKTDLSHFKYVVMKFFQACIAFALSFCFYNLFFNFEGFREVKHNIPTEILSTLIFFSIVGIFILACLVGMSFGALYLRKIKIRK